MFIRQITKKNQGYDKTFTYHRLMESVRTPRGPRQRKILDLGKLDLPKDDWKTLADLIEQILSGQQSLFPVSPHIESLALHYAQLIQQKGLYPRNKSRTGGRLTSIPSPRASSGPLGENQWDMTPSKA